MPLIAAVICAAIGILFGVIPALWWSAIAWVVVTILHLVIPSLVVPGFWAIFHIIFSVFGLLGGLVGFIFGLLGGVGISST